MDYYFLGAIVLILIIYFVVTMSRLRKAVTNLTQEEFIEGYRKAQLIDVREAKDYDAGHILGARNIPYSQFRQRLKRSDRTSPYICMIKMAEKVPVPLYF